MNEAHKLYNAVAVPKISYATDLWFCPKNAHKTDKNPAESGPHMITKQLESIQRNTAISITGMLHTSPGDAVIIHANLTPLGILLKEASLKSYARIATRPNTHPIAPSQKTPNITTSLGEHIKIQTRKNGKNSTCKTMTGNPPQLFNIHCDNEGGIYRKG